MQDWRKEDKTQKIKKKARLWRKEEKQRNTEVPRKSEVMEERKRKYRNIKKKQDGKKSRFAREDLISPVTLTTCKM